MYYTAAQALLNDNFSITEAEGGVTVIKRSTSKDVPSKNGRIMKVTVENTSLSTVFTSQAALFNVLKILGGLRLFSYTLPRDKNQGR